MEDIRTIKSRLAEIFPRLKEEEQDGHPLGQGLRERRWKGEPQNRTEQAPKDELPELY